ncbi:MAG: carbon storage regulator CsrA [Planctomycetes bacterium]|nr:carbon storage regulator CsrA [Planctomycetota bacterium]
MLVLSRGVDEAIVIGDDIVVRVVAIKGDKVRIGVEAPKGIAIHRQEIYEAIQKENREAADRARQESVEKLRGLIPHPPQTGGGTGPAGCPS